MIEALESRLVMSADPAIAITAAGKAIISLPGHYSHAEVTATSIVAYDYSAGKVVGTSAENITAVEFNLGGGENGTEGSIFTLYNEVDIPIEVNGSLASDQIDLQGLALQTSVYGASGDDYINNTGLVGSQTYLDGGIGTDTFENENTSADSSYQTSIETYIHYHDLD